MREIKASTRVRGKLRDRSVAAARAKVKRDELYLIRRHGSWFRPDAHGYTMNLGDAGIYKGWQAIQYLDVEGLSVVPLGSLHAKLTTELVAAAREVHGLTELLRLSL